MPLALFPIIFLIQSASAVLAEQQNNIGKQELNLSKWGQWIEWSACIGQLSGTVQRRSRTCLGKQCAGHSEEARLCSKYYSQQLSDTIVESQWGQWAEYGSCSVSCGGGFQTRTRLCYEKCPGCSCKGPSSEQRFCNKQSCCEWTSWTGWSQCTITCGSGGYRYRTRQCTCRKCPEGETNQQAACVEKTPCNVRKRVCTFQLFQGFPLKIC